MIIFSRHMIFVKICGNIKIVRLLIKESLQIFFLVGYVYMEELVLRELATFRHRSCLFEHANIDMCSCLDIYTCK